MNKECKQAGNSNRYPLFRPTASTLGSTGRSASEVIRLVAISEASCACLGFTDDREFALRSVIPVRPS
jgi:hypothetical protein